MICSFAYFMLSLLVLVLSLTPFSHLIYQDTLPNVTSQLTNINIISNQVKSPLLMEEDTNLRVCSGTGGNALLQFTSGSHILGFDKGIVYLSGSGRSDP